MAGAFTTARPGARPGFGSGVASDQVESASSAVSWPAIIAGAFVAAAASLVLMALGSGLGLAAVSPWRDAGTSATTFGIATGIWLILVQWIASGLGAVPKALVRTTRKRAPWSPVVTAGRVYVSAVAPGIGTPSRSHWKARGRLPVAPTANVAA